MKSSSRRLAWFSATTWIGLAGSAVCLFAPPAFASAPPAFACASGEWVGEVLLGRNDSFRPKPELTGPSAAMQAVPNWRITPAFAAVDVYDQTASDYHFGDTIPVINPPSFPILTKARVTTRLKPTPGASNDGLNFLSEGWPAQTSPVAPEAARFGFAINNLPTAAPWNPPHAPVLFVFEFLPGTALAPAGSVQVWGDTTGPVTPATSPIYRGFNFFNALTFNKRLDVFMQDDTSFDFLKLEICAKQ